MPQIAVHDISIELGSTPIYCSTDAMVTHEIDAITESHMTPESRLIYNFERGLQGPVLEMTQRGFRVDPFERERVISITDTKLQATEHILRRLVTSILDDYNPTFPNSTTQLFDFFYNRLGIPPIEVRVRGETKTPMDRRILERLDAYFYARPFANAILLHRDLSGTLQVLRTEIDDDWRWRCSYNIAGTTTGRWSSSKASNGTGKNFQNITEDLRKIFIPDPGFKLYGIDGEQAEARDVGWFCGTVLGDWTYFDACQSGDVHTYVTRMVYPEWAWTGDLKKDRKIAERRFYRHFTYRDASKRLGHACLTPDHEVLTPNGWVSITDKPEIIMEFDGQESRFTHVKEWTDMTWAGNFHTWEGQSISVKMTSPHRVLYTTTDELGLISGTAENIPFSAKIPNGWGYVGGNVVISSAIARLIAAYQCDGYHNPAGNQIRFHLHKDRKIARLEKLALEAGVKFSIQANNSFAVTSSEVTQWPKKAGAYLMHWDIGALTAYLDELPYWDGHFAQTSLSISSADRKHLEWIQTCNRLIGHGGNIQKPHISGFGSSVQSLQINNRRYASLKSIDRIIAPEIHRVLCPTVYSGFFYIRRNGKVSVTGNSNYYGKPPTISAIIKIPLHLVKAFQERYFDAFPAIRQMFTWIATELQTKGFLINAFGRRRDFLDRADSDETLRSAIAHMFQSSTGDRTNLGLWKMWYHMGDRIQLLSQLHDAVYWQSRVDDDEEEICHMAKLLFETPLLDPASGRKFIVPGEIHGGFNWAHRYKLDEEGGVIDWNPRGLDKIRVN